ncbi:MAG: hypothetical protein H6765_08215 [Candidatus Peribacteria bacterium]|nr:MAG: hypothetical protein H6765_08215 [Candidatus Peribacteria bacterium]
MWEKRYATLAQLHADLSELDREIVDALDARFQQAGAQTVLQRNSYVWKYPNGKWCYFNHYRTPAELGFSHGAQMLKENPLLHAFFDETKKMVGKVTITKVGDIEQK